MQATLKYCMTLNGMEMNGEGEAGKVTLGTAAALS